MTAIASSAPLSSARSRGVVIDFATQQPLGTVSFVIILLMTVAGIFAEWVTPYDPLHIDFAGILQPPTWEHWGGTDAYGRDIFSRIIYGARTALVIGLTSSFIGSTLGAVLGIASAYFGGWIDDWIQRFMDILLAFPIIVLALVVVAALKTVVLFGIDINLIVAIAIPIVPRVCARGARGGALDPGDALYRCRPRRRLFRQPHHLPPHGAQRGGALPDHVHRLHRAGDPARGLAVVPRPRRHRADRRPGG